MGFIGFNRSKFVSTMRSYINKKSQVEITRISLLSKSNSFLQFFLAVTEKLHDVVVNVCEFGLMGEIEKQYKVHRQEIQKKKRMIGSYQTYVVPRVTVYMLACRPSPNTPYFRLSINNNE